MLNSRLRIVNKNASTISSASSISLKFILSSSKATRVYPDLFYNLPASVWIVTFKLLDFCPAKRAPAFYALTSPVFYAGVTKFVGAAT